MFGKLNKEPDRIEYVIKYVSEAKTPQNVIPASQNKEVINETSYLTFFVDGLQIEFEEFSRVGESVKLWIPKVNNPDKVYIQLCKHYPALFWGSQPHYRILRILRVFRAFYGFLPVVLSLG
jgi:hypothetical protein